jgi:hypothetical protein
VSYWSQRGHLMYYRYADALVRHFGRSARSILDVGSNDVPLLEGFDWIPHRDALDIRPPYHSASVRGLQRDFLSYQPLTRYDFALCLQVLEHVDDPGRFARHLFAVADRLLVTVPFMWPRGACVYHRHDPVSLETLSGWTGRRPFYHIVVPELLVDAPRLIAYFQP